MQVLLLESDDRAIADTIIPELEKHVSVSRAPIEEKDLHLERAEKPDLIILDAKRAGARSPELVQEIRRMCDTPLIVLGHTRGRSGRVTMTVKVLRAGADDFLARPFHPEELLYRVRSMLRRDRTKEPQPAADYVYRGLEYWIGGEARINGARVPLTRVQQGIMDFLARSPGRLLAEQGFLEHFGRDLSSNVNHIYPHICMLRKKFEAASGGESYIAVSHGNGYYLPAPTRP